LLHLLDVPVLSIFLSFFSSKRRIKNLPPFFSGREEEGLGSAAILFGMFGVGFFGGAGGGTIVA